MSVRYKRAGVAPIRVTRAKARVNRISEREFERCDPGKRRFVDDDGMKRIVKAQIKYLKEKANA